LVAAVVTAGAVLGAAAASASTAAPRSRASCDPPSAASAWQGSRDAPQVRGVARHATLRTLFVLPVGAVWTDPARAVFSGLVGQEVKIIWGMTGVGAFHVVALGPDADRVEPLWGPQRHSRGNWIHPGAEWGTGFVLPSAGCWRLHVVRGRRSGDIEIVLR
jgi:hypothetical protein